MSKLEEIKYLIHVNGIKYSWLAHELDMKVSTLKYLLEDADIIDDELYEKIRNIIDSYQYELELFDDDPAENFDLFDEANFALGVGARIRVFAKRRYGSYTKLADALGMSPQHLQQYISGKREPGTKMLIRFLRIGCDINWLLGATERVESYRIYKLESEVKKLRNALSKISEIVEHTKKK
jgi:transcriptional regulator with XRE-family HTH domain